MDVRRIHAEATEMPVPPHRLHTLHLVAGHKTQGIDDMAAEEPQRRGPACPAQHLARDKGRVAKANETVDRSSQLTGGDGIMEGGHTGIYPVVEVQHEFAAG